MIKLTMTSSSSWTIIYFTLFVVSAQQREHWTDFVFDLSSQVAIIANSSKYLFQALSSRSEISLLNFETFVNVHLKKLTCSENKFKTSFLLFINSIEMLQKLSDKLKSEFAETYGIPNNTSLWWKPYIFVVVQGSFGSSLLTQAQEALSFCQLDTDVYIGDEGQTSQVWEVYSIKNVQRVRQVPLEPLKDSPPMTFLAKIPRRQDFQNVDFVTTLYNESTYNYWIAFNESAWVKGHLQLSTGFSVNIYFDLQCLLNFSDNFILGDWVGNDKNNQLTGTTFTQLNTDLADFSISQTSILPYKANQLSFLQPTYLAQTQAFFSQPRSNAIRNIVTAPFNSTLWMTLFGTWVVIIVTIKVFFMVQAKVKVMVDQDDIFGCDPGMWAIAATCQKSWHQNPTTFSMKMIFLIGYVSAVVSYVAYSAAIVSTLATAVIPIQKWQDLISFKFTLTVHEYSSTQKYFLQGLIDTNHLDQSVELLNTENEITSLLRQRTAFLSPMDIFYRTARDQLYTDTFMCDQLSTVQVSRTPVQSGMFVKKNSPFLEMLNAKMILLMERGLNARYRKEYDENVGVLCLQDSGRKLERIELSDVFTAFLVVVVGLTLSVVLFVGEIMVHRLNK